MRQPAVERETTVAGKSNGEGNGNRIPHAAIRDLAATALVLRE